MLPSKPILIVPTPYGGWLVRRGCVKSKQSSVELWRRAVSFTLNLTWLRMDDEGTLSNTRKTIFDSGSWLRIMAQDHDSGSWLRIMTQDHGSGSWLRIMTQGSEKKYWSLDCDSWAWDQICVTYFVNLWPTDQLIEPDTVWPTVQYNQQDLVRPTYHYYHLDQKF